LNKVQRALLAEDAGDNFFQHQNTVGESA